MLTQALNERTGNANVKRLSVVDQHVATRQILRSSEFAQHAFEPQTSLAERRGRMRICNSEAHAMHISRQDSRRQLCECVVATINRHRSTCRHPYQRGLTTTVLRRSWDRPSLRK